MNNKLKENILLIFILLIFISFYIFKSNPEADLWWDSSVYISMGKYIYSLGEIGFYEESRPLLWPLMLGFIWKLGLNEIFFGKILVLLFGIGTITLTYLIAYKLFNKKIAILSALLLAFSPTFFLFNSILFTEIPSTFFSLFGFYLLIKRNYSFSGLFFGLAFMTRFFQILIIVPIYLVLIYSFYKKKVSISNFLYFIIFFSIPVIPYFILNAFLFNNPLFPFLLQAYMSKYTGWIYNQGIDFYFLNLIKENILVLFSILGIFLIFKNENLTKILIPLVFLLAFVPYNFVLHKEKEGC